MSGATPVHEHPAHGGSLPPSRQGTVVLDIGGSVGALVVHTTAGWLGREIEIARRGETRAFVHTEVRERKLPEGDVYAAVFAELPEGAFTLLDGPPGGPSDVVIDAGCVTEVRWP